MEIKKSWLGRCDYKVALAQQMSCVLEAQKVGRSHFLGLEHNPVITLGKRGDRSADLRVSTASLESQSVKLIEVDRGGQATLHMPGQLVIYPILPLKSWKLSVREYVTALEETTISLLQTTYGIQLHRGENEPGLYTDRGKMVFFGLRVKGGVTLHGLSLNVSNSLDEFHWIRSCGREKEHFDSFKERGLEVSLTDLFEKWVDLFVERYESSFSVRANLHSEVLLNHKEGTSHSSH